jgi:hypothetical protein
VNLNNQWYLRINLGNGKYVRANVIRAAKRKTDKWISFISSLEHAEKTGEWFPYTVRLKLRNGKIYAQFSKEDKFPGVTITKDNGVIGIDINAYPFHLAIVHTAKDGNIEKYERISLDKLLEGSSEKREYLSWQTVHQVVGIAKREGLIEWSSSGNPRKIIYADDIVQKGKKRQDVWEFKDPPYPIYPTEKNLEMMKVIIQAS